MTATARKLTDAEVEAIRRSEHSLRQLAAVYRVSPTTVRNVRTRDYQKPFGRTR